MAAAVITIDTVGLQDPRRYDPTRDPGYQISSNISYTSTLLRDIRTLSSHGATTNTLSSGLLFLPSLSDQQLVSCPQLSAAQKTKPPVAPRNATRYADLPSAYPAIALAPWLSPNCALAFMAAAQEANGGPGGVAAMIVYLPDAKNATAQPPPADSVDWVLADGAWRKDFDFPVYAVPAGVGKEWMTMLGRYGGANASSVPDGKEILKTPEAKASDLVRLEAVIRTEAGSSLPSFWVFLLFIVAAVVVVIGCASVAMRCLARRRRRDLRRRIGLGQVDVEALGVRAHTVPREVLEKMPLYPYTAAPRPAMVVAESRVSGQDVTGPKVVRTDVSQVPQGLGRIAQQTTCAICLDDFEVHGGTAASTDSGQAQQNMIRELPCGHIFHAACLDPFLLEHSSKCPLCKKSALPRDYVPDQITNHMVARERQLRLGIDRTVPAWTRPLRSRQMRQSRSGREAAASVGRVPQVVRKCMHVLRGSRAAQQPLSNSELGNVQELREVTPRTEPGVESALGGTDRHVALNGHAQQQRHTGEVVRADTDDTTEPGLGTGKPWWRRAVGSMFPRT